MDFNVLFLISDFSFFLMFTFLNEAEAKVGFQELNQDIKLAFINENGKERKFFLCHPGQTRKWENLWVNPRLHVTRFDKDTPPHDLASYNGNNLSDRTQFLSDMGYKEKDLRFMPLQEEYRFSPFNYSCIGFRSTESFVVHFHVTNPELWQMGGVICGIFMFFCASSDISLLYRGYLVPHEAGMLIVNAVMIEVANLKTKLKIAEFIVKAASSLDLFVLLVFKKLLPESLAGFMKSLFFPRHTPFSSLVSFAIVYRFGPITDPRSLNLVRWVLQALGLSLIYHSSQIEEASVAIIWLVLAVYLRPRTIPRWIKNLWCKSFRRKVHLLTEDEYNREGEEETQKALEQLREYCRSLPLLIAGQLSSTSRFVKFVSGEFHVTDEEIEEHIMFVQSQDSKDVELHPSQPQMPQTAEPDGSGSKPNIVSS